MNPFMDMAESLPTVRDATQPVVSVPNTRYGAPPGMESLARVIPLPGAYGPAFETFDARQWADKKTAARMLSISTRTLDRWVSDGLPRFPDDRDGLWTYVGGHRRFRISDLSAFAKWSNEQRQ